MKNRKIVGVIRKQNAGLRIRDSNDAARYFHVGNG